MNSAIIFNILISYLFILIIFIFGIVKPYTSKNEFLFGVRIPESITNSEDIQKINHFYYSTYFIFSGSYLILFCIIFFLNLNNNVLFLGIIFHLIINFIIYYLSRRKALKLNKEQPMKREIVVVDTKFRSDIKNKIMPSSVLFFIPIFIIILNILISFLLFDDIPILLPTHWNYLGAVDGGTLKSYNVLFLIPSIEFFITIIFFSIYKAIGRSKQNINVNFPKSSLERDRIFRYKWGVFIILINTLSVLAFSIFNFTLLQLLPMSLLVLIAVQYMPIIFFALGKIILGIALGQGGNKLKLNFKEEGNNYSISNNDDKYWILGIIYFNRKDPAFIVEKRFGIGWALNWGRIESYILMLCIIVLLATFYIGLNLLVIF